MILEVGSTRVMAALVTLSSVKCFFERTLRVLTPLSDTLQDENDTLQDELLVVTFFWAEGKGDDISFVQAEHIIAASIPRDIGCYRLSSREGGAMLWRSICRNPINTHLVGVWDCWLVPAPEFLVSKVDVAAKIAEAGAAMKVTNVVTVQLGHRVVICESTFLLASISTVLVSISTGRLHCGAEQLSFTVQVRDSSWQRICTLHSPSYSKQKPRIRRCGA